MYKSKFLKENKLKESSNWIYELLRREGYATHIKPLMKKITEEIGWDIDLARSICLHLLEDVNDSEMMEKVNKIFLHDNSIIHRD